MWNFLKYWIWKQWSSNQDTKCCHCKVVFLCCPSFGLLQSAQIQIFFPMKEAIVTTPYSGQYIARTRNNLCIISISLPTAHPEFCPNWLDSSVCRRLEGNYLSIYYKKLSTASQCLASNFVLKFTFIWKRSNKNVKSI